MLLGAIVMGGGDDLRHCPCAGGISGTCLLHEAAGKLSWPTVITGTPWFPALKFFLPHLEMALAPAATTGHRVWASSIRSAEMSKLFSAPFMHAADPASAKNRDLGQMGRAIMVRQPWWHQYRPWQYRRAIKSDATVFATFLACASRLQLAVFQTDVPMPPVDHRNCRGNSTGSRNVLLRRWPRRPQGFCDRAVHG